MFDMRIGDEVLIGGDQLGYTGVFIVNGTASEMKGGKHYETISFADHTTGQTDITIKREVKDG